MAATVAVSSPAMAGTPTANASNGQGTTIRAALAVNYDGSGYRYRAYGPNGCTQRVTDADNDITVMANGWNDAASWATDITGCSIRLFVNGSFTGSNSGWLNFQGGHAVDDMGAGSWNDITSSWQVS
ncbi:hypothetical protein [Nocardioides sp.]|uniref:hypothetical protein n=1 Tax=Nocardioides sp. TaxID=35761 RepID=UPI0026205E8C|nr:hypothetical protein [Nocardioides sp.]